MLLLQETYFLLWYLNVFIMEYNFIINRMARSKNMMENNDQIDLKFGKKLIFFSSFQETFTKYLLICIKVR